MDSSNDNLELFPIPRYFDYGEFNFYYPYGNTPAEDFLENVSPHSVKEPNILVLGCGDIRSCFYTLWKHFTTSLESAHGELCISPSNAFSGVHFVLNDHSAAVLARNIIFLHLCLQKPAEASSEEFKKWLCGFWAIWFSRSLLPAHEQMLSSSLRDLLKYATDMTSWASQENPLGSLVHFSSERTFSEICKIWRMWSTQSVDIKAVNERQARRLLIPTSENTDLENMVGTTMSLSLSQQQRQIMAHEIQHYSENSFAEYVVSDGQYLPPKILAKNLTMYATSGGKFVLHSLLPFRCFHHAFQFSPSQLQLNCNGEALPGTLTIADGKFEQFPLLANSVQQFALWLSRASAILSSISQGKKNIQCHISFTFHCSDAIAFCNELQRSKSTLKVKKAFDVIYTSNLIDPVYPPNLVLFAVPLLKPSSYLFTTTIKYKTLAHTTQEYLEGTFGIDNKMLPILFGIRCINYDGNQYKSAVSIRPAPVEANAINPQFTPYYMKVLIWEKVSPMIVSSIPPNSSLWCALYSSVSTILSLPPKDFNASSSQTVVKMLQTFLSHVYADDSDASFWDPLCSLLRSNENVKHLMTALQTHSMLSGLHLHLTITSKTCPVCNEIDLMEYVGQFCVSVKSPTQVGQIHLYARLYESEKPSSSYSTFDCLASHDDGSLLNLYFIAPLHLCESGYYVRIVSFGEGRPLSILTTGPLQSFLDSAVTFSFSNIKIQNRLPSTSFGSVSSHYGNGDSFESVIQLSDIAYEAYTNFKKISPHQLSPALIKLSCGIHNFELSYPHPINFKTLTLQISRSRRTITIKVTRECHRYEDETAPVCLVNPDNALIFPQLQLNESVLRPLMGMQFIDSEQMLLTKRLLCPPLPNLKNCINMFMQVKEEYFTFSDPSDSLFAMVMIVKRVFDYQLKAPAIDLVYCVTTAKTTVQKWLKFSSCVNTYEINHDTIQLMDKTFQYFSGRTICSFEAEGLMAVRKKVDSSFKRAIVYPLYGDADDNVLDLHKTCSQMNSNPLNKEKAEMTENHCCSFCRKLSMDLKKCKYCQTMQFCDKCQAQHLMDHTILCERNSKTRSDSKSEISPSSPSSAHPSSPLQTCGYCHKSSTHLKKCLRCLSVLYCSKECQKQHWREHKVLCCKQPIENTSKCSYCNTVSDQLKRCTTCFSAQYCNRECQKRHWKEHQLHCSKHSEDRLTSCRKPSDFEFKQNNDEIQKCNFCSRVTNDLKKCTRCLKVQYCGKTCQQKHWPDHKIMCKSKPS